MKSRIKVLRSRRYSFNSSLLMLAGVRNVSFIDTPVPLLLGDLPIAIRNAGDIP